MGLNFAWHVFLKVSTLCTSQYQIHGCDPPVTSTRKYIEFLQQIFIDSC